MPISSEISSNVVKAIAKPVARDTADKATQSAADAALKAFGQDAHVSNMSNHARFFDTNFDNKITLRETNQGLQDIKLGNKVTSPFLSLVANLVLGDGLRAPAGSGLGYKLKNLFTVNLDHLAASAEKEEGGKALDPIKRVAGQMKFDTGNTGAVTLDEIGKWVDAENPGKNNGRTKLGFGQLFQVGADTTKTVTVNGVQKQVPAMTRESLEHFYQGTLFYDIAARNGHPHPLPPAK